MKTTYPKFRLNQYLDSSVESMSKPKTDTYEPNDTVRFVTPAGRELQGDIILMGDSWGLVHTDDPVSMNILIDLATITNKVIE